MKNILPYIQIILSAILMLAVLMQHSEAGLGSLGGGDTNSHHGTRRGFEKFLFYFTIVVAVLFAASAFLAIVI